MNRDKYNKIVEAIEQLKQKALLAPRIASRGRPNDWQAYAASIETLTNETLNLVSFELETQSTFIEAIAPKQRNEDMNKDVCVVFGTYNRLALLQQAVESIRQVADGVSYEIAVVDGGSTDGSINWLETQSDVVLFKQELPLTGAVKAFNIGFGHAVDSGAKYVFHFNDDARLITPGCFRQAIEWMEKIPQIGEIAFEFNLRGGWGFEDVNGHLYANYGLVRMAAGMAVAREQGDPTGKAWWNPIYRTYGADCEFGVQLWRLGWTIHPAIGLRVDDLQCKDALRELNQANNPERTDSKLFWDRFSNWRGR